MYIQPYYKKIGSETLYVCTKDTALFLPQGMSAGRAAYIRAAPGDTVLPEGAVGMKSLTFRVGPLTVETVQKSDAAGENTCCTLA